MRAFADLLRDRPSGIRRIGGSGGCCWGPERALADRKNSGSSTRSGRDTVQEALVSLRKSRSGRVVGRSGDGPQRSEAMERRLS